VSEGDRRQQMLQLVALRDLDLRRAEAQQLIDSVPRVLASRFRDGNHSRIQLEAAKEKLKGFLTHLKHQELELAAREEALQKANANLLTAKTNQEYTALMGEIQRRKEEKSEAEGVVIEQYDVIKQGEAMVAEAEERVTEAESEYGDFETRARNELREHQGELTVLNERRDQIRKGIDGDVLKVYDRAYNALGSGLASSESNVCQGCFSSLTPNDRSRLISNRELIICRSCQRILYLPEVLLASPQ